MKVVKLRKEQLEKIIKEGLAFRKEIQARTRKMTTRPGIMK
jgi:hypothetical protein